MKNHVGLSVWRATTASSDLQGRCETFLFGSKSLLSNVEPGLNQRAACRWGSALRASMRTEPPHLGLHAASRTPERDQRALKARCARVRTDGVQRDPPRLRAQRVFGLWRAWPAEHQPQ